MHDLTQGSIRAPLWTAELHSAAFAERSSAILLSVAAALLALSGCATAPTNQDTNACTPPPFGDTTLFLRGSMSSWAALEDYAFQYRCDGYYLNVDEDATHDFKIADAAWADASTFGSAPGSNGTLVAETPFAATRNQGGSGTANLRFAFKGEHTVSVRAAGDRFVVSVGPKSFTDPQSPPVTDAVALSVRFDSRVALDKRPFGAIPAPGVVEFSLSALPGIERATLVIESRRLEGNQEVLEYTEIARAPMQRAADGARERWQAQHRFDRIGVYGYWFEIEANGVSYVYQNNRNSLFWTRERGTGGTGAIAFKPASSARIRRYRQTVFDPGFKVPEWAPDIVYYYIFPERFRNGDPANDPKPGVARFHDGTVEVHTDWNDKPWISGSGDGSDARYSNDFYGGDIAGIIEKLDDIRELGANALYITPLFKAASNHKYDTADYLAIDPGFGVDADFQRLTRAARERGIRVIPDTSLNHTGIDSPYFDRYGNHPGIGAFENGVIRPDSPYASWYRFNPNNAAMPYQGWTGARDLPEIDKSSADFRRFAYGTPTSVMQHWLDQGAAGWRMDVAPWVPDDFWREWRTAVRAHRPDALTVAETWFDASKYLLGDMFDSTMNYIFRNSVLEYAAGGEAHKLVAQLEWLREAYPPQAFFVLMNLLSTHDQARSLHVLAEAGKSTAAMAAPTAAASDEIAEAKQRLLLAVLVQMTFPGAPTVYYGDEVGVTGGDDPLNRATYPWPDRGGKPDLELRARFKELIALRRDNRVLRHGSVQAPVYVDANVVAWLRRIGSNASLVIVNNAAEAKTVTVTLPSGLLTHWLDDIDRTAYVSWNNQLTLEIPARFGRVLMQDVVP